MEQDDGQVTAAAVEKLAANVSALAGEVAALDEAEREREKRTERKFRNGGVAVAVVALLLAVTAAGLAWWNVRQDASHRAAQQQNTAFRQGFCKGAADIGTYLASAPAGPPAGQEAAARLEALFRSLCAQP